MTSERDQGDGLLSLASTSISNSPSRVDSESDHPLRGQIQREVTEEGVMSVQERSRLQQSNEGKLRASRSHTFADQNSAIGNEEDENERDKNAANKLSGLPDRMNSAAQSQQQSSSWGHPDPRGRLQIPGLGSAPGGASRPSTLRSASHTGMPSLGTGYEGNTSSRLSIEDEAGVQTWRAGAVGSTPLERTIDAIGMGRYQYAVLVLSGLGWAADNMWLQGIAIVLPRVQDEWQISNRWIGLVSSCTFAGMMVGALAWGSYADAFGRKNAFNITLLVTSVFGLLSSFSPSFPLLCLCLFLLGTGVGGSMPTDGTIFLEALPKRKHYLLTALSVFFAAGSVISSVMGLVLIPRYSCGGSKDCNVADNKGWRWLLASLGVFTLLFVIARLVFFSLFESPKFLVSAGRHEEARSVLQRIADFNGEPKKVRLSDVRDQEDGSRQAPMKSSRWRPKSWIPKGRSSLQEHNEERQRLMVDEEGHPEVGGSSGGEMEGTRTSIPSISITKTSWRNSIENAQKRYAELFSPHWAKTTILVWSIWTVFTLAYTMVNIFLPKYLQDRSGKVIEDANTDVDTRRQNMESIMQEFLFYSLASLPGSIMGAYLIETSLGRIKSMAISTTFLALSLLTFASTTSHAAVIASSCSISLFASTSYAVIYSYSPEVFETSLRGTASGTASALSRLAGMLAPLLAGFLISISPNLPLYLGFLLFAITVALELSLPYETKVSDPTSS